MKAQAGTGCDPWLAMYAAQVNEDGVSWVFYFININVIFTELCPHHLAVLGWYQLPL